MRASSLPSLDESKPSGIACDCCKNPIYAGESYYKVPGANICESCILDYIEVAEIAEDPLFKPGKDDNE